jgi:phytoene synthase
MRNGLSADYEYCQALTRREAKNFYYGFMLLPERQRHAIYAAYAFARQCDDIADDGLPLEEAQERLVAYRGALDRCIAGDPAGPVFTALKHSIDSYEIPAEYFYDLIRGVETDLQQNRYETFDDLRRYCHLVASVVGLISIEIFGYAGGEKAREHAADLGVALQLTNILRDIREDGLRDRVYIPSEEVEMFGYSNDELLSGEVTTAFRSLMAFQVTRAREYFAAGRRLLPYLPRRARACVGAMSAIYESILDEIARRPSVVFRKRVSLSTSQKLALAGRELMKSVVA